MVGGVNLLFSEIARDEERVPCLASFMQGRWEYWWSFLESLLQPHSNTNINVSFFVHPRHSLGHPLQQVSSPHQPSIKSHNRNGCPKWVKCSCYLGPGGRAGLMCQLTRRDRKILTSNDVNFSSGDGDARIASTLRHRIDLDPDVGVGIEPLDGRGVAAVHDAADGKDLTSHDAQVDAASNQK